MCCTWNICWKLLHATPDVVRPFVLSKGYDGMPCPTPSDRVCCPKAMMACHPRRRPTVCAAQGLWWHATPYAVRPCVLPKGDDGMTHSTSLNRVCCPTAMTACHGRRRSTVCAAKRRWLHAMPDDVRPSVLPKGYDGMPRPTLSDRVCCPRAMMAWHARRRSTICAVQGRWWHATPDVVWLSVLPNGDDGVPRPTLFDRVCCPKAMIACHARRCSTVFAVQRRWLHFTPDVPRPCLLSKGSDGMPRPTSFNRVCGPRSMMAWHARRRPIVCAVQGRWWHATPDALRLRQLVQRRWWHATPDVIQPCLPFKGYDGMPRPALFDRVCCPKAMIACHARRRPTVCAVKRRRCHATPDVADHVCCPRAVMSCHARRCQPCMQSKGGNVMPRPTLITVCTIQGR